MKFLQIAVLVLAITGAMCQPDPLNYSNKLVSAADYQTAIKKCAEDCFSKFSTSWTALAIANFAGADDAAKTKDKAA